jgi:hypothetical protein
LPLGVRFGIRFLPMVPAKLPDVFMSTRMPQSQGTR